MPRAPILLLAALTLSACDADPEEGTLESDLSESLTLRFEVEGDALSLRSSGRRLACAERFDGLAGERITCARSGERLQVIVKDGGEQVVAVRDLAGKRGYYGCSPSGDAGGLPSRMKCRKTSLRPRGAGGLSSPFDATVPDVSIPNTHWVGAGRGILRGMEPRTPEQFDELRGVGVERVLIFKNATGNDDVGREIVAWDLPAEDVLHVPFHWKDLSGFQEPCEQTLEALRFVRESVAAERPVFFHCTVGEDRTGLLSALFGQIFEGREAREAFDLDMCERGYASGNPQKPGFVLGKLEDGLTPLYRAMSFLVAEGLLGPDLDPAVCAAEPAVPDDFLAEELACGVSTTLVP